MATAHPDERIELMLISIHTSSRVATMDEKLTDDKMTISIHATHAGGDPEFSVYHVCACLISIHATHAGGDQP